MQELVKRKRTVVAVNDEKFRYLLRFSKNGPLCYIGHLDLLRVFQQTVRRAKLPAAYSQGFNPHQLISFALPLPLGMASENDYAEIYFTQKVNSDEVIAAFNAGAPEGLTLTLAVFFPDGPGVAACAFAADYEWKVSLQEEAVCELLNRNEIVIPKKTKSGVKDTDIRPDIYEVTAKQDTVLMRLSAGSQRFLNPLTAAALFLPAADMENSAAYQNAFNASPNAFAAKAEPGQFIRKELYRQDSSGKLIKLSEIPLNIPLSAINTHPIAEKPLAESACARSLCIGTQYNGTFSKHG